MKIKIDTSSHYKAEARNQEAFKELNKLLFSDENPLQDEFNREELYLDDTNGLVSVIHSSSLFHVSQSKCKKLNKFIRKHIEPTEIFVFIGNYTFKK